MIQSCCLIKLLIKKKDHNNKAQMKKTKKSQLNKGYFSQMIKEYLKLFYLKKIINSYSKQKKFINRGH